MNLKEILNSDTKEKESKISALFRYDPPKEELLDDKLYSGLAEVALSTSFQDYYAIYKHLNADLIDYGAGFCKGSLLFESLGEKRCFSYELKQSRLDYAQSLFNELNLNCDCLFKKDLLIDQIPIGENYLIYLPLGDIFFRLVNHLLKQNKEARLYVIESHGDFLDYLDNIPQWFKKVDQLKTHGKRHRVGIHIYDFHPNQLQGNNILYEYIKMYGENKTIKLVEGDKNYEVELSQTLPIRYNGKMALESFELKRMIDNKVILFSDPHLVIGE